MPTSYAKLSPEEVDDTRRMILAANRGSLAIPPYHHSPRVVAQRGNPLSEANPQTDFLLAMLNLDHFITFPYRPPPVAADPAEILLADDDDDDGDPGAKQG
mmetsp:Transcript_28742/g.92552  ORF Transcript_28742/g.92552 Transcript_28742/m.92552 type:complete len:101 (+) Transcript_28742:277-579(+)